MAFRTMGCGQNNMLRTKFVPTESPLWSKQLRLRALGAWLRALASKPRSQCPFQTDKDGGLYMVYTWLNEQHLEENGRNLGLANKHQQT
jgi:hypothetical protein